MFSQEESYQEAQGPSAEHQDRTTIADGSYRYPGTLSESQGGNNYILVIADYFTRWTEAYPIPNQEATTIARKLTDELFFRYSVPEQLHSDQGCQFESELIAEVRKLLKVSKFRTTPYHPQSDGLVERYNRTLLNMLSTSATKRTFSREDNLRILCTAYNTSIHPTTGYTPFYLMFGRQARMPVDIMYGAPSQAHSAKFHSHYAQVSYRKTSKQPTNK